MKQRPSTVWKAAAHRERADHTVTSADLLGVHSKGRSETRAPGPARRRGKPGSVLTILRPLLMLPEVNPGRSSGFFFSPHRWEIRGAEVRWPGAQGNTAGIWQAWDSFITRPSGDIVYSSDGTVLGFLPLWLLPSRHLFFSQFYWHHWYTALSNSKVYSLMIWLPYSMKRWPQEV